MCKSWGADLTKFCKMFNFSSQAETKEAVVGFMHVKDSGRCGGTGVVLSKTVADAAACVARVLLQRLVPSWHHDTI